MEEAWRQLQLHVEQKDNVVYGLTTFLHSQPLSLTHGWMRVRTPCQNRQTTVYKCSFLDNGLPPPCTSSHPFPRGAAHQSSLPCGGGTAGPLVPCWRPGKADVFSSWLPSLGLWSGSGGGEGERGGEGEPSSRRRLNSGSVERGGEGWGGTLDTECGW